MTSLINIYDGVLQYIGNEIIIIIDNENDVWFNGKQIVKILEYKNTNDAINNKVSKNNKITYDLIRKYSKNIHEYNIQNHSIFINENGLY
jgi:prophage antirepressor-like protein